jgi:hypothetical protein
VRKKTVDISMVREVLNDLDMSRFVSEVGANGHRHVGSEGVTDPFHPIEELAGPAKQYVPTPITSGKDYLSPAEAIEHMRDVARLLHNWRSGTRPDRNSA